MTICVQDVLYKNEATRDFITDVLFYLTAVPPHISLAARIAFITIGKGMRLVIDHSSQKQARLAMDPDFSFGHQPRPIDVPLEVAQEMINTGLMKQLDRVNYNGSDADWWCMIQ
jgi:hypothetical protein